MTARFCVMVKQPSGNTALALRMEFGCVDAMSEKRKLNRLYPRCRFFVTPSTRSLRQLMSELDLPKEVRRSTS